MGRRRGRGLEELIAAIEKALRIDAAVKITSPGRLRHRVTGKSREVDVLLTHGHGRHKSITAIECKNWKRPVDSPVVEHWAKKCQDLRVNKGIIVSSKGFTEEALVSAQHEGISCLTISEIESFPWIAPGASFTQYKLKKHFAWTLDIGAANGAVRRKRLVNSEGEPVALEVLNAQASQFFDQHAEEFDPRIEERSLSITFDDCKDLHVIDEDTGERHPVLKAVAVVTCRQEIDSSERIHLHEYVDHQTGERIEIAGNKVELGGRSARIMFVPNADGGRTAKLVFD